MITFLFFVVSCGKPNAPTKFLKEDFLLKNEEGNFISKINPLNAHISNISPSEGKFMFNQDRFVAEINVKGADSGVKHFQFILTSDKCPTLESDLNKDSIIDVNELLAASGNVLVPLDSDLGEQFSGMDFGPISNESGDYRYRRSSNRYDFWEDLTSFDPDSFDQMSKLPANQKFQLYNRVLVILGVSSLRSLPSSVSGLWNLPIELTIPIGCGTIEVQK